MFSSDYIKNGKPKHNHITYQGFFFISKTYGFDIFVDLQIQKSYLCHTLVSCEKNNTTSGFFLNYQIYLFLKQSFKNKDCVDYLIFKMIF